MGDPAGVICCMEVIVEIEKTDTDLSVSEKLKTRQLRSEERSTTRKSRASSQTSKLFRRNAPEE